MDNESEFKKEFKNICKNIGLINKVSNKWNPQWNAILERIHQVLDDGLQAFDLENNEINPNENDPFDEYLNAVVHIICSKYHQTHSHSPAQLVFGQDMLIPVSKTID